ncbi:hypothetical protein ROM06_03805 [Cronobacter sakazakii]|uniref:hypothetical protein n=1 Tax=Cronobacter sakazakii TaxID=28141 RepID=UPI0028947450|nr:hypothetical protein [Cronobacter sakazakii]ELY4417424.1 hypothetical protein [Cronobacter sakazakii]MDT3551315.1 hypothetical protein [Cronobacter sakazakii]
MSEISKERAQEIFLGNGPEPTASEEWELARIALDWLALRERAEPGNAEFGDAYQGAREDLQIWKRRALEAEGTARRLAEINDYLVLQAQGECHFGEPVVREPGALLHCAEQLHSGGTALYTAPPAPVVPDAIPETESKDGNDIDYMEPSAIYELGKTHGWNACRAAMLATPGKEG